MSDFPIKIIPSQRGRTRIVVGDPAGPLAVEEANLADRKAREDVLGSILKRCPGLDRGDVEPVLLAAAARVEAEAAPEEEPDVGESSETDLAEARKILASGDLVDQVEQDLADVGIEGEQLLRLTVYLLGTSRLLRSPLHAIIRGDSSTGKSYVVEQVARLFPPEAIVEATHLSPKALYRMESLSHRWLVLGERSRNEGPETEDETKAIRELRSSGRLRSFVVEDGKLVERTVEGPVASTETTTKEAIFDEDANRCFLLSTDETTEQTRRILTATARRAAGEVEVAVELVVERHRAIQRVLAADGPLDVAIPFAEAIARSIPPDRAEARRAFPLFLGMIRASAVLHRLQRTSQADGKIVATVGDYALAKRLVGSAISSATAGAPSDTVRRFAEHLVEIVTVGSDFTAPDLAERLGRARPRINELLRELRRFGMIEQVEEAKGPNPARWNLRLRALPDAESVLPDPEAIR
jgi:hypothetical protein